MAATLAFAALGEAQAQGDVRGRIFESLDSTRAVVGAEVELAGTAIRGRSDVAGHFHLRDVPAGEYELRIRRLGFKGASKPVTVGSGSTTIADVAMQRSAAELSEVVIEGKKVWVPPRLGEVYERAARGEFHSDACAAIAIWTKSY